MRSSSTCTSREIDRRLSSRSDVFERLFVPDWLLSAVSDRAWLQAMLDAERALATAESQAGVISAEAAEAIAAVCEAERYDVDDIATQGRAVGNPVEPLARALAEAAGEAGQFVHWGATSQDVLDTAAMLVAREAVALIRERVDRAADACAALADTHRTTPMVGRTLLQQAVPTTFGAKSATWLTGLLDAREDLTALEFPAQLGGAAGTLAPLGDSGPEVVRLFAEELGLSVRPVWHTIRTPIARIAGALDLSAGVSAKIALDLVLLAQTEVGEVREGTGGPSSTMPHKQNPKDSTLAVACARVAHGHASTLTGGLAQEHERAAGAWHAEWPSLTGALTYAGGAVAAVTRALDGLEVDVDAMRRNLELTHGAVFGERITFLLAERMGRREARELLSRGELDQADLPDDAFDVEAAVATAGGVVEQALDRYGAVR
jgi:3-carboxy-cis,cis-muconate cycloisomerase